MHQHAEHLPKMRNPSPLFRSHKKTPQTLICGAFEGGGRGRNRTGVGGFAIRCITILLLGHLYMTFKTSDTKEIVML